MRLSIVALAAVTLSACATTRPAPTEPSGEALPFIEDDYAHALGEAKALHKPLFVDVWAPW